ncbi:cupin domain-containing protein [Cypionkella sp.]|uniref:cupin domain-containing protein n=1 Tax=Cypionkella sp. TaxID=2811411 RepID=UPI003750B68D
MIVFADRAPISRADGVETQHLSVAGGLRQFGAYVETLAKGAWSSNRHWHEAEDEFLFVLDGTATLHDDNGLTDLTPGDAITWRQGEPNAHHITNRFDAPLRYLIVGARAGFDTCHYPDSGNRLQTGPSRWQLFDGSGTLLRAGDNPPELCNLPPAWGFAYDGSRLPQIHRAKGRAWVLEDAYRHPILGGGLGPYLHCVLGDAGGLSQFGAHLERLPAGSGSSFRHWHEAEDEMLLLLAGTPTLIENQETVLAPGAVLCWPAGSPIGHRLENRGQTEALYLTLGTRLERDVIHYPDHDLITQKDGALRHYLHADGRPWATQTPHQPA